MYQTRWKNFTISKQGVTIANERRMYLWTSFLRSHVDKKIKRPSHIYLYSQPCLKQPLKNRQNKDLKGDGNPDDYYV